ncbi:2-oxoglutarate dehydrogenase complex dihydrolipoyllysine-residue succinyltransferase [Salibacterium halotolerans]|uniref:Dihydrolipoyllysine-residue succinyltransferase component of 2-oxoglutarate dehydrogenase complex n=1 Tax=Salibacterium halotolerans TaxID=1884432 RepID=A0A1I5QDY7_9BACI|nr:2-oxoglutarate dehydrogenase complex dihydrolipoyllysine-residue succinyltransferase [Salibacterium halotolerans]SFP44504.1 2-oxoglutarate dehydrogenase E2 component (dihydrolipoamide succinyltransferase) [Salibacterium halotolerans]
MAEIKVPELAESITEGTIAEWLKQPGDAVEKGENIAELETDKINVEITSEHAGVIQDLSKEAGDTVEVGDVIGHIDESGQASGSTGGAAPAQESEPEKTPEKPAEPAQTSPSEDESSDEPDDNSSERPVASPAARKMAREKGLDLNAVPTKDPMGRVRKEDVENYESNKAAASAAKEQTSAKESAPAPKDEFDGKPVERQRMSRRRQTIASRLVDVQQNTAMLSTFNEIDMSAVMDIRKRWKETFQEQHDVRLGFMSFFTKAVIAALKQFPLLNAEIDGNEIIQKQFYDIGMAVSTENGLIVPVVKDADRKSFAELEQEVVDLSLKARDNKLSLSELQGGSFTITNGGVFGSLLSTPILNAPQVGILGMHKIQWRPVAIDQENMENRPMMYIALSYDHRIVDGKEAVSFLVKIKELLENPESLMLEG